jgi:hypothetical protein
MPTGDFVIAAQELREQEFSRLATAIVPSLEGLRSLNARELRARVVRMLERLDYELLTPETAADLLATKDGKKYLFSSPSPRRPIRARCGRTT